MLINIKLMKKTKIVVVFSSHLSDEENNEFIKHIENTIGCKHQVVCYPNFNEYSLPEVYNKAINDYSNEETIMVFSHNDIQFQIYGWGKLLLTKFNNTKYEILGVAGATYLNENGIWWHDRSKMHGAVSHTDGTNTWLSEFSKMKAGEITEVVLIDGLFMAADCENLEHRFDEEFKGYHFYDISFCLPNFLDGVNIGVTGDIRILHKSVGQTNQEWENNRIQFSNKYRDELPIKI